MILTMKWKGKCPALEQAEIYVLGGKKTERIDGGDKLKLYSKNLTRIMSQVKGSKDLNLTLVRENVRMNSLTVNGPMAALIRKFLLVYKQ